MRWRKLVKLVGIAGGVLILGVIYWGYITELKLLEWIGLLSIIGAIVRGSMSIFDNYYNMFPKMHKIEIDHTDDLIRDIFEKPVVFGVVVYDKDEIHRTCAEWAENVPGFKQATDHLNHKKYREIWYAYLDGKQYDEDISNKIITKIQQYQNIIEQKVSGSGLALTISQNKEIDNGEYSQKWINHLIFYDVLKKFELGDSRRKLEIKPFYYNLQSSDYMKPFYLDWIDSGDVVIKATHIVAKGDATSLESLQNTIEQIENDNEIIYLVLEIASLNSCLKKNLRLKTFEAGILDIIRHIKITKEILAGFCNGCP